MASKSGPRSSPPPQRLFARLSWLGLFLLLLLAGLGCVNPQADRAFDRAEQAASITNLDLAITNYTDTLQLAPDYPLARYKRANAYFEKGDYDNAIADYTAVIRLKSTYLRPNYNYAEAYYYRGASYYKKRNYDKAIADFNELIRLQPNGAAGAYVVRSTCYGAKRDWDKAIADATEAIRLKPDAASTYLAYYYRGYWYELKGDSDKALADESEAIRLNPDFFDAYYVRGVIYDRKDDWDKAVADYSEVIRLKPDCVDAYNGLAWLLAVCSDAGVRNGQKAIEYATKACELSGWKSPVYFDALAVAYAEAGNFDEAIRWENKYLESDYLKSHPLIDTPEKTRQRLGLFEQKKPYHEEKPSVQQPVTPPPSPPTSSTGSR